MWATRGRAWLRWPRHGYYTMMYLGGEWGGTPAVHVENTSIDNQFKMLVGGRLGYIRVYGGPPTTPSRVVCASWSRPAYLFSLVPLRYNSILSVAHSDPLFSSFSYFSSTHSIFLFVSSDKTLRVLRSNIIYIIMCLRLSLVLGIRMLYTCAHIIRHCVCIYSLRLCRTFLTYTSSVVALRHRQKERGWGGGVDRWLYIISEPNI